MRLSLCIVQNLIELELEEEETVNKRNEKRERETMQNWKGDRWPLHLFPVLSDEEEEEATGWLVVGFLFFMKSFSAQ